DFVTVGRPNGFGSAVDRYLNLSAGSGKRHGVDFIASGFIGLIGDPAAIARKGRVGFVERCLQKRLGFSSLFERERPKIKPCDGVKSNESQCLSVRGPGRRETAVSGGSEGFSRIPDIDGGQANRAHAAVDILIGNLLSVRSPDTKCADAFKSRA